MSLLTDLVERLQALLFRSREEREFQEEARLHLALEVQRNRQAGMDETEARRRAALNFGGVDQIAEQVRDARGTRGLLDQTGDVAYALRSLRHRPGFVLVSVLTIAIGIGGTTAIFSAVDAVLFRPLPYRSPEQLVRIYDGDAKDPEARGFVSPVPFLAYRDADLLQAVAATNTYDETGGDAGTGDDAHRIRFLQVSADYFDVLRAVPAIGRGFERAEENGPGGDGGEGAPVIVLSHRVWEERFHGDPDALGQTLTLGGNPYTVVGVMADGFADPISGLGVDAWVPISTTPGREINNLDNHWLTLMGRLRPGVTIGQAEAELNTITARLVEPFPNMRDDRARVVPLKEDITGPASRPLALMLGAVGLVLLLVCVNIANLLLVRASERHREFAVRAALGAGRGRLVRQLLTESLVLAALGAAAGLVVARAAMTVLIGFGGGSIPRLNQAAIDLRALSVSALLACLSAVLFGLAPAWRASRTDPGDTLRGSGRANSGDRAQGRLRTGLVVSQVTLAFVLLAGAGVLLASFRALTEVPLGITPDRVLTFQVHLPESRYDSTARAVFHQRLDRELRAIPGVRAAGATSYLPATGSYHVWGVTALTGSLAGTRQANTSAEQRIITPDYFQAMGIPILAGRGFDAGDGAGAPDRVVISSSLVKQLFPDADPLGQQIRAGGRNSIVIGVVPDVAVNPEGRMVRYVYHAHAQFAGDRNWSLYEVVATPKNPDDLREAARRQLQRLDPGVVMDRPAPLTEVIGRGTAQRRFTLVVILAFAATALLLAAIGIFGVLSYVVKLRGQEFGIRAALGASPGRILGAVIRQGAMVVGLGIGFGLVGSVALSRVLGSLVFQVSPLDPVALLGAALLLILSGTLASWLPARRAAEADPRRSLE